MLKLSHWPNGKIINIKRRQFQLKVRNGKVIEEEGNLNEWKKSSLLHCSFTSDWLNRMVQFCQTNHWANLSKSSAILDGFQHLMENGSNLVNECWYPLICIISSVGRRRDGKLQVVCWYWQCSRGEGPWNHNQHSTCWVSNGQQTLWTCRLPRSCWLHQGMGNIVQVNFILTWHYEMQSTLPL